jgi:hypothetical protein
MKRDGKVFLAVAVILSFINVVNFIFYGQKFGDLALAVGFSCLAVGAYKDNNQASFIGAVIVICGFISKWFLDYDLF